MDHLIDYQIRYAPHFQFYDRDKKEAIKFLDTDILFIEWADLDAINYTRLLKEVGKKCKVIVRCISYEVDAGLLKRIDWSQVDEVIFIDPKIRHKAQKYLPSIKQRIIPMLVDTKIIKKKDRYEQRLGILGHVKERKGILQFLDIMARLPKNWLLCIKGFINEPKFYNYMGQVVERYLRLDLVSRVFLRHWDTDKEVFYDWADYIVSCSFEESFHVTIAEGIMHGCIPIVYNWPSSDYIYPSEIIIWPHQIVKRLEYLHKLSLEEKQKLIERCQKWVVERYSSGVVIPKWEELLENI